MIDQYIFMLGFVLYVYWVLFNPEHWDKKQITGYDILRLPDCPYNLPKARSMTQAGIDYRTLEPALFAWYQKTYRPYI